MGLLRDLLALCRADRPDAAGGGEATTSSGDGDLPCRPPNVTDSWVPAGAAREHPLQVKARIMKTRNVTSRQVVVDPERCTACAHCAAVCPDGAITVTLVKVIDPARCSTCGCCISTCPSDAIRIDEQPARGDRPG